MKTFEVKIKKDRTATECKLEWPSWWGQVYQKVNVVAYQSEDLAEEGAVCLCDSETWKTIAAKNDPLIVLLTETTANEKGRAWRPQQTRVTDEQAVLLILARAAQGKKLTVEELKALDPEDPALGVGKTKLFDITKLAGTDGLDPEV